MVVRKEDKYVGLLLAIIGTIAVLTTYFMPVGFPRTITAIGGMFVFIIGMIILFAIVSEM